MFFVTLAFLFTTLGCESTMSNSDIGEVYKNKTLHEFMKERYTHPAWAGIDKAMGIVRNFNHMDKELIEYTYNFLPDNKSVLYLAGFSGMNESLLYKPLKEFNAFCMVKGGEFQLNKKFKGDIEGLRESTSKAYFNALMKEGYPDQESVSLGYSGFTQTYTFSREEIAKYAASQAFTDANNINHSMNGTIFNEAVKNGAFGEYSCVDIDTKKTKWNLRILPVYFQPQNASNDLDSDGLYMVITPF